MNYLWIHFAGLIWKPRAKKYITFTSKERAKRTTFYFTEWYGDVTKWLYDYYSFWCAILFHISDYMIVRHTA